MGHDVHLDRDLALKGALELQKATPHHYDHYDHGHETHDTYYDQDHFEWPHLHQES